MSLRRFDLHTAEAVARESDPEPYRSRWASIHRPIGGEHLHGNLIVIPPGLRGMVYHWEASLEEWLLVVSGTPTVRTPDGEHELRVGDVACFPAGPPGAHQVLNRSHAEVRIVVISDVADPKVVVYPDSGKVAVTGPDIRDVYCRDTTVDYWEGE